MRSENIIILIGRVGKTPDYKVHGDTKVCEFSLATTKTWKDKKNNDELKEKTTWHNIVCFGSNAEYARDYVKSGAECYVNGEQDNYTFKKNDGETGYGSQVIASKVSANKYEKKPDDGKSTSNPPTPNPEFPNK